MSEHEFENYLALISRLLRLSAEQRTAIGEELRDHFESRLTELTSQGLSHEDAVRLALEEFGDAAGLAAEFSKVTQNRRRRLIMRCTVGSIAALAAAAMVAMAMWPDPHAGPVVGTAVAQTADKQDDKAGNPLATIAAQDLTAETQAKLNKYFAADYEDVPLKEFLDQMQDSLGVQIYVKWNSLKDAAPPVDANSPITVNLSHVRGKMLLALALEQHNLGFMIDDGIIFVATKDRLDCHLDTRVYDCRAILAADILAQPGLPKPATSKKTQDLDKVDDNGAQHEQQTSSSTRRYFHFVQAGIGARPMNRQPKPATPADKLIDVICTTIAPGSWNEEGGPGAISEYNGLLIVSQTAEMQTQVADLLEQIEQKLASRPVK